MVKKSIHKKVLGTLLRVSLSFALVICLVALGEFWQQRRSIERLNEESSMRLTGDADVQLEELNREVAESLSSLYATIVNDNFVSVRQTAESLAGFMGTLYAGEDAAAAEAAPAAEGMPAVEETSAIKEASFSLSDGAVGIMPGADLQSLPEEFNRVKTVRSYIRSLAAYDPNDLEVLDIYVVTDSGMCLDGTGKVYEGEYAELRDSEWYSGAKQSGRPYWARAFTGAATGIRKITCGVPFTDEKGTFRGVAAVDLSIEHIYETALATRSQQVQHALLLDDTGEVMINPDNYSLEGMESRDGLYVKDDGFAAFTVIPETNWTLCTVFQFDLVRRTMDGIRGTIDDNSRAVGKMMGDTISRSVWLFLVVLVIGSLLVVFVSGKMAAGLSKPINRLTEEVAVIGGGNLDHKIEALDTGDEISLLADAFNHMTGQLKEYIENLSAVTAEKERIGAELGVATHIQASMLPCIFPAFPGREEFEIYASMQPAREVGGDFYDFFLTDSDHLAVVMADVSGKGVPAALFMVIAKTLIKNHAQAGEEPAAVFTNVNRQLCETNDEGMFVTAWLGILEISTGKMAFVNAGHNPPLLCRAGEKFDFLQSRTGFVLAGLDNMVYKQEELQLREGDMLYLYTDGVTEATDTAMELYGNDRLLDRINGCRDLQVQEILDGIKSDLEVFGKGAPQFDDITMLLLRIRNCPEVKE